MSKPRTQTINEILENIACDSCNAFGGDFSLLDDDVDYDQAAQAILDHLLALPELQPIPRIKSFQADNSLAIKVDDIRQILTIAILGNGESKEEHGSSVSL